MINLGMDFELKGSECFIKITKPSKFAGDLSLGEVCIALATLFKQMATAQKVEVKEVIDFISQHAHMANPPAATEKPTLKIIQ